MRVRGDRVKVSADSRKPEVRDGRTGGGNGLGSGVGERVSVRMGHGIGTER